MGVARMRKILKKIQQYLCSHNQVIMKSGAHHKAGWKHYHKVKCRLCEKEFKMLGSEIYTTYTKEKECYCAFEK
jgi:hypothetical protein